jgi:hypothetical protein
MTPRTPELLHRVPSLGATDGLAAYAHGLSDDPAQLDASPPDRSIPGGIRIIVLHYSGYGYAANGAPQALVRQCAAWRGADPKRRLLVVFHELFARQPPWRKGFWWAPLQRRLLRRLVAVCDGGLSTLELHSGWLRRQGLEPFATLPVPSNVGETSSPLPLPQRSPQLVVFGGRSQRQAAYAALRRQPRLLERLAITAIHDVGPPLEQPTHHPQLPIQCHGLLNEAEVAELLGQSLLGAVSYPLQFLAKSGIFAALCAHGTLPLVLNAGRCGAAQADGLRAGHTFITPAWLRAQPGPATALAAATPIAASAWHWYQPHRLSEQRGIVEAWLATLT